MKFILLFTFLISVSAWGMDLKQNSLILTHTSKYYHTDSESELVTQDLMRKSKGPIIALVQDPLSSDLDWYGLPLSLITHEFYSHAGEHTLIFPKGEREWHVTVAGGYLSACLGRTLTNLVANFITGDHEAQNLVIHLPMKAIFTGFIEQEGKLIPDSPYKESILDSSMDGLNLDQVLKLVPSRELTSFMKETVAISIYQKSPMHKMPQSLFWLGVDLQGKRSIELGERTNSKKIILKFE